MADPAEDNALTTTRNASPRNQDNGGVHSNSGIPNPPITC